jgi:hypothetical protein
MFVVALLAPQIIQAQGTTYLSNLGQPITGSEAVGSDSWLSTPFYTGSNVGGYTLDSFDLAMSDATGSPDGFTVMLYNNNNAAIHLPANILATLNGSTDPSTTGIYTYTPGSNLILSPNTIYEIVITAGTTIADGAYEWSVAGLNSYSASDNWAGGGVIAQSNNGSSWGSQPLIFVNPQFAINATAIPEPSALALIFLASGVLIYARRTYKRQLHS